MNCPKCKSKDLLDPFYMNFKPDKKKGHNKNGQEISESYVCRYCGECFEGVYELKYIGIRSKKLTKR